MGYLNHPQYVYFVEVICKYYTSLVSKLIAGISKDVFRALNELELLKRIISQSRFIKTFNKTSYWIIS